jgi:hypothetical protein
MEVYGLSVGLYMQIISQNKEHLPVASNSLKFSIVTTKWNVESDNSVTGLDKVKIFLVNACL